MIPIFYVNYDLENLQMVKSGFQDDPLYDADNDLDESFVSNGPQQHKATKERGQPKSKDVYEFNNTHETIPDINFPSNPRKRNMKSVNNKQEKSNLLQTSRNRKQSGTECKGKYPKSEIAPNSMEVRKYKSRDENVSNSETMKKNMKKVRINKNDTDIEVGDFYNNASINPDSTDTEGIRSMKPAYEIDAPSRKTVHQEQQNDKMKMKPGKYKQRSTSQKKNDDCSEDNYHSEETPSTVSHQQTKTKTMTRSKDAQTKSPKIQHKKSQALFSDDSSDDEETQSTLTQKQIKRRINTRQTNYQKASTSHKYQDGSLDETNNLDSSESEGKCIQSQADTG